MKENYKGYFIEAEPSSPVAHSAKVYEETYGNRFLIMEVFTLHGAYAAIKGAKGRINQMGLPDNTLIGKLMLNIGQSIAKFKRRLKNKQARSSRKKNR